MLSIPHIIVIFIVVLVIFGPEKLPELARNFGKVMAEFRRATGDLRSSFDAHMRDLEREAESRRIGGNVTASSASPAVATPATPSPQTEPAPSAPGTVPSNPPNAAALPAPRTQEPSDTPVTMFPAIVQIASVVEVNVTARVEVAEALTVVVPFTATVLGEKVIAPIV